MNKLSAIGDADSDRNARRCNPGKFMPAIKNSVLKKKINFSSQMVDAIVK